MPFSLRLALAAGLMLALGAFAEARRKAFPARSAADRKIIREYLIKIGCQEAIELEEAGRRRGRALERGQGQCRRCSVRRVTS
jgi:hypothetical protein